MRMIDADALQEEYVRLSGRELSLIDSAPTVDAVNTIKHGEWLFYEEPDGYYHSECSECGQWCDEDVFLKGKWHYCPNCGAKMDGAE